jgi:putative transposase
VLEPSIAELEGQAAEAAAQGGQPEALRALPAPTRECCESLCDDLADWLRRERQAAAADTLNRDWDDFVTFYDFRQEHWLHIRTTNPLESVFAGVRLRTDVAKRARKRVSAL